MLIKPSSPTPDHKKHVKLSLLDQLSPPIHVTLVFFYPPINEKQQHFRLELPNSLSKTLTYFYPYAGRIVENHLIECSDEGVLYEESEVNGRVDDVLSKGDPGCAIQYLPDVNGLDGLNTIPLVIKVSFFECGGVAIGVSANHRIMDGVAISTFMRSWAAVSSASDSGLTTPDFTITSTLYPPSDDFKTMTGKSAFVIPEEICVTKRFVFNGIRISEIKEKMSRETTQPTRVEAISSLIWKQARKSSKSSSLLSSSIWTQMVNMRRRWDPPLPENTPGNLITSFSVSSTDHTDDEETSYLAQLLKNGLRELCKNGRMTKLSDKLSSVRCLAVLESIQEATNNILMTGKERDAYALTSWCGFKLYDADFGWGKPEWVCFPGSPFKNFFILMDTKEGNGIEALITLTEAHMAAFEQDEDFSAFAINFTS